MADPTWTILIPTIGQREALFRRLLDVLLPQLDEHAGRVRVLAWWNNGRPTLGSIRQGLVEAADTDYVSFVDDDDLVAESYVADIVHAMATGRPDHVGFQVQYYSEGVPAGLCDHSLRHRRWYRRPDGLLCRDFTHIDPIRRDLALRGNFRGVRPGRAEDRAWVKQVRPFVRTEEYIDKVLYHYLWSADVSAWQRPDQIQRDFERPPVVEHPYFAWHPGSS